MSQALSSRPDTECDLSDAVYVEENDLKFVSTVAGSYEWEKNDCGVQALAIGANICYEFAHEIIRRWGRSDCRYTPLWFHFIRWSPFRWKRYVRRPIRLRTFLKRYPKGRFIVYVRLHSKTGHTFNVIDGVIYDYLYPESPNSIVYCAWEITGLKKGI